MEQLVRRNGHITLNVCACGKVHFTYGPISLHFDRQEFFAFATEVGRLAT